MDATASKCVLWQYPRHSLGYADRGNFESMKEYEYNADDGSLKYRIEPEGVCITGWRGQGWLARIPEQIEDLPVTAIDRKAFLSRKKLREARLPVTLRSIGDWAFAYCNNLERVTLPAGCGNIGKALFLDCGRLDCVEGIRHDGAAPGHAAEAWPPETGRLLAAGLIQMEAYYLLDPSAVGSPEWLRKWDARLEAVLDAEDQEGYSRQVLCGEEDYGSTDLEAFLQAKRQKKARLAMLRLLCGEGLGEELRGRLEGYLKAHTKGCESEESWQVVLAEGETRPEYVRLFLELGCVTRENIEAMILQMRKDQPQLRASFLRFRQERLDQGDFFDGLSL